MKWLIRHALAACLALTSVGVAQDMTTIHIDSDEAIHTETNHQGDEQRDVIEWADNNNVLHVNLHVHVEIGGQCYCLESEWILESGEMTRKEVADRIARDFRTCLINQGMFDQDAQDVASSHGATVLVTDTPRSDGVNAGTPDAPDVTATDKGGPSIVRFVDGPNGR